MTEDFSTIARLAAALQTAPAGLNGWLDFERALASAFGHRLFTVLAYDAPRSRLRRVHSSRPELNPVGGAKAVTESDWTRHVLQQGQIYVGATPDDIRSVFSEHALLAAHGCDSVLNIPVRQGGVTVGTLNLLHGPNHYDDADRAVALIFAQLASGPMGVALTAQGQDLSDDGPLEHV